MCPPTTSKTEQFLHFSQIRSIYMSSCACAYVYVSMCVSRSMVWSLIKRQFNMETCVCPCIWSRTVKSQGEDRRSISKTRFSFQWTVQTNKQTNNCAQQLFVSNSFFFVYWPTDKELFKLVLFIVHSVWILRVFCGCSGSSIRTHCIRYYS